ncbi:MAG TPA: hypothetical protein PKG54_13935 [Phycisphaerae bacterium]|jgi:hypothetical protein|nr:hypothetical protein [Phycisphaerae bacterium]HOB75612.1 hypothetical protein [Phycisphaerae bacterium]HOJ56361.1 hypothetical protein [Phycisphaerae bacterium]HOL28158.1 hypothetical protein [Phycisphaerae bacterium]HPP22597.1 hypothetical protein [Phycisphaerae bacterium]
MKAQVLRGSKREIAEAMVQIAGEVREAIVFVDEPSDAAAQAPNEDIFAEMEPFTVRVGGADYSRETLYNRIEGE